MYKQDGRARGTLRLWLSVLLIAAQALLSPLAVLAEDMPPPTLEAAVEPSDTNPAGDVSLTPDVPVLEGDPVEPIVPGPLPDIAGPEQIPTLDEADPSDIPGVGEGWDVPQLVQAPGRTDMTPMDVRDVLALAGVSRTSIIDGLSVAFMEGGYLVDTPDENAEIALTLHMLVPQGVPSMLAQDDWYTVTMPGTLVLDEGQAFDLAHEGVPYARLDTRGNEIHIRFQDAARAMDFIDERFTVQAVFAPGEYASGQEIVLSLPDEDAPDVSFTIA